MAAEMDDDDFGEFVLGGKPTPRSTLIGRLFFGLLGTALCGVGAVHLWRSEAIAGLPLRIAAFAFMLALAAVFAFNVTLQRRWRWPLWLAALGLPLLFIVRLVFGA
jgi:hypothetical protein